jgi:hypothetical protein
MNDSAGSILTVSKKKGDEISDENSESLRTNKLKRRSPHL